MVEQDAPGVRRLERLVERVAPRDPVRWEARPPLKRGRLVSRSRADQLRATVRQLGLAVGHEGMPERCGRSVKALLAPHSIDAFLELASEGEFRDRRNPAAIGRPLSWSTLATLRDCLVILGEEAGVEMVVPRVYRQRLDLAPVAGAEQLELLYGRLVGSVPADATMARSLACAGMVLDSRMRSGDLVTRRVGHLHLDDDDGAWVDAVWHHQGSGRVREDQVPLRPGTVTALRRWLAFRADLVAGLQGSDHGMLWVTAAARARLVDGVYQTYEVGMPLGPWGMRRGFSTGMDRLNEVLASAWEGPGAWVPLPPRVEQWRRGVEWAQEQAAARGSSGRPR
ncbi:hypothetical protein OG301_39410 (plasmid) [Streptomyces platensis]|uniref:hypothetical protein n=1 Tax=Streptomyces platensis TaxID=58346 RepID=UPI002ED66AE2|nr:hypothetical protein OG301_39410 [Streptomyces platensis]